MAIREIPPEQKEMENAEVLVENCLSCIELCKTGTFLSARKPGRKPTNILDQKENLVESLSMMVSQLGTVVLKLAPEKKVEIVSSRSRARKETANSAAKYPILRSLLRRNKRSKSENRKIEKSTKLSFRSRIKSERIIDDVDSREDQLVEMCNLAQTMSSNISHLITQCFVPVAPVFDENIILVFERSWAAVFSFEATFYAYQTRTKADIIIPKGMSYPTESDIIRLIKKLTGHLESLYKIVPKTEQESEKIQNLTECNRYLRELYPILRKTFVESIDQV